MTHTHTHAPRHHTQPPPDQTAWTLKNLFFVCLFDFCSVLKMVSINGRRKAEIVCEFIHSFIHPSITHETWWLVATLNSARNSYWTDTDSCIHTHTLSHTQLKAVWRKSNVCKNGLVKCHSIAVWCWIISKMVSCTNTVSKIDQI